MLFAILAWALAFAPALAKPPVWTVHGKGATVTLFGSVHVLPRGMDWEPDALKAALAGADELWFETPLDDATLLDTSRLALAQGMLPAGQTLSPMLSPDGQTRLAKAAADLNVPLDGLERLKPWLAELTLGAAEYAKEGATSDQGVERQLLDAAPQAARRHFETPAQQIAMFAGGAQADQIASLEDTLKELQDDPGQSQRLIDAWLAADLKAIDKEGLQELRDTSAALFKLVLTDRNAAWIKVLRARLDAPPAHPGRPDRVVVVVGVGHLIGPEGLPAQFRGLGFTVDGPR